MKRITKMDTNNTNQNKIITKEQTRKPSQPAMREERKLRKKVER